VIIEEAKSCEEMTAASRGGKTQRENGMAAAEEENEEISENYDAVKCVEGAGIEVAAISEIANVVMSHRYQLICAVCGARLYQPQHGSSRNGQLSLKCIQRQA